jgi:Fe-S cluster assembly scaffold IscU
MKYSNKLMEHFDNPKNVGTLDRDDPNVGTGIVGSPACGDVFQLQLQINPDTKIVEDVKFKTFGCGAAIASASYGTELIKGKPLDEVMEIRNVDIVKELELPNHKVHCSCLVQDSIAAAVKDYELKHNTDSECDRCKRNWKK